jgi:hypothetical protein
VSATATRAVEIDLDSACGQAVNCRALADRTFKQLATPHYSRKVALLQIEKPLAGWLNAHRTARRRASVCEHRGYHVQLVEREQWIDDIYAVNVSMAERQGRPMSSAYFDLPSFQPLGEQPCPRHRISCYGTIAPDEHLVAYLVLHRVGELLLVSQLLDNVAYREDGVGLMYLLFREAFCDQLEAGPATVYYNRFDSGTDGLRYFKSKLGFVEADVDWGR